MIRLSVIAGHDSRWQALTPRLRGVVLDAASEEGSLLACDAAVFFELALGEIERYLLAGKPVLVAAEQGLTKETLQTLCTWGQVANLTTNANLVVSNPDRYLPSRQLIYQHLQAGKFGEPGLVRIHRWGPDSQEGSMLFDLDLVLWFFRAVPRVVFAVAHQRGTQIHLGFPAGGMALVGHADLPAGEPYYSLSVIGASGAAYADDHSNVQLLYRGGSPRAVCTDEGIGHWASLVQEFADAVRTDGTAGIQRPHWSEALRVAQAVETSLQTNQAVALEGVP